MKLTDLSVRDILAAFRSSQPTPGGGSASALSGAIGASLLAMAAGLPKPAASSDEELSRLQAAGARCGELARKLESLIDRDSEAYDMVVAAYRLPKSTGDEKTARTKSIQDALRAAIEAPLAVIRACRESLAQATLIERASNPNASSDVQVGMELLKAGQKGATLNVEINLPGIKDHAYAEQVRQELEGVAP